MYMYSLYFNIVGKWECVNIEFSLKFKWWLSYLTQRTSTVFGIYYLNVHVKRHK